MKSALRLPVKVRSEEVSVHLGSYPGSGKGDRPVEASGTKIRVDGLANAWAATRVKPEQASKDKMRAPNRLQFGEGRWDRSEQRTDEDWSARRGMGRGTRGSRDAQHGRPVGVRGSVFPQPSLGEGPRQESEGPVVPRKPGKAGGGKGPWFGVRLDEPRGGGLA